MIDVARILNVPYGHAIYELTLGAPSMMWAWDEHVWLAIEAAMYDHPAELLIRMLPMLLHDEDATAAEGFALLLRDWYGQ